MNIPCDIYQSLEYLYDKYSPVIYGIALQISSNEKEAEQILTDTFQKINNLKIYKQNNPYPCIKLIKLTIETAYELFPNYKGNSLALKQFRQTPILSRLLSENNSIKSNSPQNNQTHSQSMKSLRAELSLLFKIKKEYLVRTIIIPY